MGAANLKSFPEESFRIISGTLTNAKFTPNLITTGRAPLMPGSKIAVAAVMEKHGAQLLAATFEESRSITDVSINLLFKYEVMMPRVEGMITVDWSKVDSLYQQLRRDYVHADLRKGKKGPLPSGNKLGDDIISDTERDYLISYLKENKAVIINMDIQELDNPIAQQVVEAYMEYFTSSIADKEFVKDEEIQPIPPGEPYIPNKNLYQYHFRKTKIEKKAKSGTETYKLTLRLPMVQEMTITENLASWYDGVKNNDKCIATVNLNDPFFEHRDINFILNADAEEMIQNKEISYVTVDVLKERSTGNNFERDVTFDKTFITESGIKATLNYARDADKNTDFYKYKCQWSFKDGDLYPQNPQWVLGNWQAVTLTPPIKPRKIEFEANLDELAEMGFVRASLELRYFKFGREYMTNIPMTVSKGQSLIEQIIYTDRDQQGYAYRVILTNSDNEIGKLALDWEAKINDDYVFASIPKELVNNDPEFIQKAKKAAQIAEIVTKGSDGEVKKENEILSKFKDVLDVIDDN